MGPVAYLQKQRMMALNDNRNLGLKSQKMDQGHQLTSWLEQGPSRNGNACKVAEKGSENKVPCQNKTHDQIRSSCTIKQGCDLKRVKSLLYSFKDKRVLKKEKQEWNDTEATNVDSFIFCGDNSLMKANKYTSHKA